MRTVERIAAVLRAVADASGSSGGISLLELSRAVELPLGSTHRLAEALSEEGLLVRDPVNRKFSISASLYEIGIHGVGGMDIQEACRPALERLRDLTRETVFLSRLVGSEIVCVAMAEGRRPLRLFVREGQTMPAHAAASARVILAQCDEIQVRAVLTSQPLESFTRRTPTKLDAVMEHLARVREQGYDVCEEELDADVWAIAAPVVCPRREIVASVAVAAPRRGERAPSEWRWLLSATMKTAAEITRLVRAGAARTGSSVGLR